MREATAPTAAPPRPSTAHVPRAMSTQHPDNARVFYGRERPPILELIYPMATSARDLDRVREYYERFVSAMEHVTLAPDDLPMGTWFGRFAPKSVRMIPLVEDREHLVAAD